MVERAVNIALRVLSPGSIFPSPLPPRALADLSNDILPEDPLRYNLIYRPGYLTRSLAAGYRAGERASLAARAATGCGGTPPPSPTLVSSVQLLFAIFYHTDI